MIFLDLVNSRLDYVKAYNSADHYRTYQYMARRWIRLWGKLYCGEITAASVQDLILERNKISSFTANKELRYLRATFNYGLKKRFTTSNPTEGMEFLPVEKKVKYVPSIEDVDKVIEASDADTQDYLWTIRETLARVSEINRLTWDDVNFEHRYVVLYTRKKKGGHLTPRKVFMTDKLFEILAGRFKRRDKDKPWVFWHRYWSSKEGAFKEGPFGDRKKIMKVLCKKAGVRYFRFHPLRHAGASIMDESNVPLGSIQRILGHENRKTTEIYLHSIGDAERQAMAVYEQARKKSHTLGAGPVRLEEKRQIKRAQEKKEKIEGLTFGDFFKDTYLPLSKQHKKELSWKREEQHFRLWIRPVLEALPLRQIAPLNLEKIKNNMMKALQSPRSIQYCFSTIRSVWNMARRDGIVQADSPTRKVKLPKFDNRRQRYLTQDECERLLEGLKKKSQQVHNMALLSLECGLRFGEVCALDWLDVNLQRGTLTLRNTKNTRTRTAYMTDKTRDMFKALPKDRDGLVFKNAKGGMIDHISSTFDRVADAIGLNDGIQDRRYRVVYHSLRHTYASRLIEHGGADLYTVKELLGHTTMTMTERYSHLTENSLQNAVKRMELRLKEQPQQVIEHEQGQVA